MILIIGLVELDYRGIVIFDYRPIVTVDLDNNTRYNNTSINIDDKEFHWLSKVYLIQYGIQLSDW